MHNECPHCAVRLEPEPGFYQGAMYVGYSFTIMGMILVGVLLFFLGNPPDWVYVTSAIGLMILVAPLNYRYSRILYLYLFGGISYDSQYAR